MKTLRRNHFLTQYLFPLLGIIGFLLAFKIYDHKKLRQGNFFKKEKIVSNINLRKTLLLSQADIGKHWHKKIEISSPFPIKDLFYEIKGMGHFKVKEFQREKSRVILNHLPLSYNQPAHFYTIKDKKRIPLLSKTFKSPSLPLLKDFQINQQKGNLTSPFYAVTGLYYPDGDRNNRIIFPMILNKWGEVIFSHTPAQGKEIFDKYATIKVLKNGNLAILYSEQDSFFEIIDFKGNVHHSLHTRTLPAPYVIHHDFHFDEEKQELYTFGTELKEIINFSFESKDFKSWVKNLLDKPLLIVNNPVIRVDIKTGKKTKVYDPLSDYFPLKPRIIYKGVYQKLNELPRNSVWSSWGKRGQVDLFHSNTLEKTKEGWLISYRNLHKVAMLDHDFKKIHWSMGLDEEDFFTPHNMKHAFFRQHHVSLTPQGTILLIDNHTSPPAPFYIGTRVLEIERDPFTKKYIAHWNYQPQFILHSLTRGSAYQLKNKNILAFYPDAVDGPDHIIEVEKNTGQPKATLIYSFGQFKKRISDKQRKEFEAKGLKVSETFYYGGGNRALPLDKLIDLPLKENHAN